MDEFQIRFGQPVPPPFRRHGLYSKAKGPLSKLNVGECFTVPRGWRQRLARSAWRYKRENPGWDYAIRTDVDLHETTIWRTA